MAQPITIDIILSAKNQTEAGVREASKSLNDLVKEGKQASESLGGVERASKKTKTGLDSLGESSSRARRTMRELARERYEILLEAKDRVTPVLHGIKGGVKGIAGKTWNVTLKAADYVTRPVRGILNLLSSVQGMVFGAAGVFGGIVSPMDTAGDFEQTQIAFSTMLKDAERAKDFLAEASDFANNTPFEFPDLIDSSKLLLAFGFDPDSIFSVLTTIGDTSSGLGAGAQGIDRITRALGQIQAKGRVLTEELMQLQELGIPVNQILQEELGLTQEQVANIGDEGIRAEDAISGLLRGMDKRYGGMMENQSKTAKGLMSTISDTLQNTFLRRWGTGLWEGFKPGLERITEWLNTNQDTVDEWADRLEELRSSFSQSVMGKIEGVQRAVSDLMEDPAWQGADFLGKVEIAWDRLISDPLSEWWSLKGKETVAKIAEDAGIFLGTGLNRGVLAILGINDEGIIEDGLSAGKQFIDGFLDALEGDRIREALKKAASGIFKDSAFGGGDSPTSPLSTLAVGMVGLKGLNMGIGLGRGIYGTVSAARSLGKLLVPTKAASVAKGAAVPAASVGISLPALASVTGGLLAFLGLGSAVKDLRDSGNAALTRDKERLEKTGVAKGGLVLAGAAAGSLVAPGIGTLVGGGLGGLAALFGDNFLSDVFKSERERALEALDGLGQDLEDAVETYNETASKVDLAHGLLEEYEELKAGMNSGEFDHTKAFAAQERMKQILEDLQRLFPGMVSSYETLNGLSDERIDKLDLELDRMERQSELEREQAERKLKEGTLEVEAQLPKIKEDYQEITQTLDGLQPEWERNYDYQKGLTELMYQYSAADPSSEEAKRILEEASELSRQFYSDDPGKAEDFSGNPLQLQMTVQDLEKQTRGISEEMDQLIAKKQEMDDQLATFYSSSVQLEELDTGIDLDKEQEKLQALQRAYESLELTGTMDEGLRKTVEEILPEFEKAKDAAEQMGLLKEGIAGIKDEVQPVLERIGELNERLDMLPEEKKIHISWDFSVPSFSGFTPSPQGLNPLAEKARTPVTKHAFGGFTSGPELSWIGEDGLEAVIPLSGKYRKRGLELYEQAGRYLGVSSHAEGGMSGNSPVFPQTANGNGNPETFGGGTNSQTMAVPVTFNHQTVIQVQPGDSEAQVKGMLWQSLMEMIDPLALQIANVVLKSRENSPGGGT